MFKKQCICTSCGYVGNTISETRGSLLIEIILWLFFIIPGLIYSIWRLTTRYEACPKCRNQNMIPVDSPVGKKLFEENKPVLGEENTIIH
jgi:hypothetical protein